MNELKRWTHVLDRREHRIYRKCLGRDPISSDTDGLLTEEIFCVYDVTPTELPNVDNFTGRPSGQTQSEAGLSSETMCLSPWLSNFSPPGVLDEGQGLHEDQRPSLAIFQ